MEDNINNIVKNIIYKCRNKGILINNAITYFLLETKVNYETNNYYYEENFKDFKEDDFINEIENIINKKDNVIDFESLKMLIKYKIKILELNLKQSKNVEEFSNTNTNLIDEIINIKNDEKKDNFEIINKLYKKIFNLLVFRNKKILLEDKNENTLNKEITAAMESVIPRISFSPFLLLNNIEKINQLSELSHIIIGIRIFNKCLGKGGYGIKKINELVTEEFENRIFIIDSEIKRCLIIFENLLQFLKDENFKNQNIKNEILFLKSFNYTASNIFENLENLYNNIIINESRFKKEIETLKTLLGNKSSAPKEKVYPKFAVLSQSYHNLINDIDNFNKKYEIFNILTKHLSNFKNNKRDIKSATTHESKNYDEFKFKYSLEEFERKGIKYIFPDMNVEFMETNIDYNGHCLEKLSNHNILVPGNPKFGIFILNSKKLIFSDIDAINFFYENPHNIILDAEKKIKNNCIFKFLLEEDKIINLICFQNVINGQKGTLKMLKDQNIDTPIHFRNSYIDHNYYWNEWEMRKKAIQMANIRNMKTISCQTQDSIFKINNETQVNLPKDKETMTGINRGNNPIWPRNYTVGLRNKLI